MGEHFGVSSHNGRAVSRLVNHLIHGLLCQVGSQSMDRLLDKLTIFLGFVKLYWFMLDKPLCFQWFCQAKFRSNAGYGPIYSISAWQTDDSIPDLSSYIGSCLTNWCVFSGFVKHITAQTTSACHFHRWPFDLTSRSPLTSDSACHFQLPGPDLTSRPPLRPHPAWQIHLPHPDLSSRLSSRSHLTYRACYVTTHKAKEMPRLIIKCSIPFHAG